MYLDIEVIGLGEGVEGELAFECGCRLSRTFTGHLWVEVRSIRIGYCCIQHRPESHFMTQGNAVYFYGLHQDSPFHSVEGLAHGRLWPERDAGCRFAFAASDHAEMMRFVNPKKWATWEAANRRHDNNGRNHATVV